MSDLQQDRPAKPEISPFIPHAVALGKAFQDFARRESEITPIEIDRIQAEAAERIRSIYALSPQEPIDALILLSMIREFAVALQPVNNLPEDFAQAYVGYIYGAVQRLEDFISAATGTTMQAHGVNLTNQPWN